MNYDEFHKKASPYSQASVAAGHRIEGLRSMFEAAGTVGDEKEMERLRDEMKTQIDIQCDAKMVIYRLIRSMK